MRRLYIHRSKDKLREVIERGVKYRARRLLRIRRWRFGIYWLSKPTEGDSSCTSG